MIKPAAFALLALAAFSFLVGCDDNPTNAPEQSAVIKANQDRKAAIENDPSMTPEGKKKMIEMLNLDKGTAPATEKR
jgi:hypothetical protein